MQIIRIPALIISISVALLSGYLTFMFMSNLGESSGLSGVYGLAGVIMDASKCLLPFGVIATYRSGREMQSILLGSVTGLLIIVSFYASVSAFDVGRDEQRKNTSEYIAVTEQIEILKNASSEIRKDLESLPSDYKKVRREESEKARAIDERVTILIGQRAKIKTESATKKYLTEITVIAAGALEIIGVCMAIILSCFSRQVVTKKVSAPTPKTLITYSVTDTKNSVTPTEDTVTQSESSHVLQGSNAITLDEDAEQETVLDDENNLREEIRKSILSKKAKPSVRGVRQYFSGIGNDAISEIIKQLGEEGFLRWAGNRWVVVERD